MAQNKVGIFTILNIQIPRNNIENIKMSIIIIKKLFGNINVRTLVQGTNESFLHATESLQPTSLLTSSPPIILPFLLPLSRGSWDGRTCSIVRIAPYLLDFFISRLVFLSPPLTTRLPTT